MRILILSWEYPPVIVGGLGRHVHALSTALARQGHDVTVVSRWADGAPLEEILDGVHVLRAPTDPPSIPMNDLLAWTMALNHTLLRAALRADLDTPDVVHAHDWLVAHAATTLKEHFGVPLVTTLHATEAGRHQGWLPGPLNRAIHTVEWWLTYEARRVVTCSRSMAWEVTRLFELPPGKVDVIGNGTDLAAFRAPARSVAAARARYAGDGPLLVLPGRLEWEKGAHVALAAMPRLRRRHPGIRLVLAGAGTQEQALRDRTRQLRLGRCVTFAGRLPTDELAALLGAADVTVAPSLYEPFGLVALESAVAGTPLVVSDTGGLAEFVDPGRTGLRVAQDDPAALADGVSAMLADEVAAARIARTARAAASGMDWNQVALATAAVFERAGREERALQASTRARPAPLRMLVRDGNLLADGR